MGKAGIITRLRKALSSKTASLLLLTVVLCIVVYIINPGFLAKGNIRGILNNLCVQGVMLAGLGILLMSGNIDLSSAGISALGSLVFAELLTAVPTMPWPVAALIAIAVGVLCGLINVFFMNVVNLMPFIVTIGMSSIFGGIAIVWTRGNNVTVNVPGFINLGKAALFDVIPLLFFVMLAIVLIHGFVLSNTRFGRSVYMVGGNPYAARLSGLDPKKVRAILFVNNGIISVIGGLIWTAQKKMASPTNLVSANPGMTALTAIILGGVSFMGGSGGMTGAFAGMLLLNVFTYALAVVKIPTYVNVAMQGLLLIVALILDNINAMRMRRILTAAALKGDAVKKKAS